MKPMDENIMIKLADFSRFPSGRDAHDGDFNGEKYREHILRPAVEKALNENRKVEISLEGVLNFGSSFLEEAFGGLVRKRVIQKDTLKSLLVVTPDQAPYDRYKKIIFTHIQDAKPEREQR